MESAIELSEKVPEVDLEEIKKMKTLWCIELDLKKKIIAIRPGNDGCISLRGAQEAWHFIKVLKETIQETF